MIKALLWDVDGTLAETESDGHRVAFNLAFEQFGLHWRWSETRYGELLQVAGGRERLLADMATRSDAPVGAARDALAVALHDSKNAHYARLVARGAIGLRPGVLELMSDCAAQGVTMAIATTTSRRNVEALCEATLGRGGLRRFAALLCAEDAPAKKPDPLVYVRCLAGLGVAAQEVIAIEDSPAGVAACHAAGVPVVVTRSRYFPHAPTLPVVAHGPSLADAEGWSRPAAHAGRITLAQLDAWWQDRPAKGQAWPEVNA